MDNTVGSLSQVQMSVVIGSLLGDGYLRIMPGRRNAFLEINHSFHQHEYVDWKYDCLRNITKSAPKMRRSNGNRSAYRFFTKQLSQLTELYSMFYKNRKKIVPKISLNPLSLAVWYMDDGSKCRSTDIYLNSQQFDYTSQINLIGMLDEMNLKVRLNKDKQYLRLRFLKSSIHHLQELIEPFIIPSMRYKLEI
ncbi:MAG: DNA endonuclease family protein [Microgenomates bacterium OLB23]|nr:MAG: DNA endonuclease family protein [Microgenomates bacterium OLB23]